ncbi:MAG: matrixin family metalloprotease [Lactobacillaceae bacterium]|jgi:hypothetical protein|nr:matrixin family metalloprotease [Lactobacillaceae bacterium]
MKKIYNILIFGILVVAIIFSAIFLSGQLNERKNISNSSSTSSKKTLSEKELAKKQKAIDNAYKKTQAEGEQYIKEAQAINPYKTDVVIRSSNSYPASALAYAPDTSNHYDDILQVYVAPQSQAKLLDDTKKAISFWNDQNGSEIAKMVNSPQDADVIVEFSSEEQKLNLPSDKGGLTYYNVEGSLGKNSYILIHEDLDPSVANQDVVVAHEMGHALGLAHSEPDDSTQATDEQHWDLMNTIVNTHTPYSLSEYDKLALKAAKQFYPLAYKKYLK